MGWTGLILAFVAFFVTHSAPIRPPMRPWLVRRLGTRGFTIGYSLLSLGALALLIVAAGRAPFVRWPLWDWTIGRAHLAVAMMLAACLLLSFSLGRPNPLSFGGFRNETFDPAHPGLRASDPPSFVGGSGDLGGGASSGQWRSGACDSVWRLCGLRADGRSFGGPAQASRNGRPLVGFGARGSIRPFQNHDRLFARRRNSRSDGLALFALLVSLHQWFSGSVRFLEIRAL